MPGDRVGPYRPVAVITGQFSGCPFRERKRRQHLHHARRIVTSVHPHGSSPRGTWDSHPPSGSFGLKNANDARTQRGEGRRARGGRGAVSRAKSSGPAALSATPDAAFFGVAHSARRASLRPSQKGGRTGFDFWSETQAACRGRLVGLVKTSGQKTKRRLRRSRSRGLIDRDVPGRTPATAGGDDSRLIHRRSNRADG
jgi:hypothetical protein